MPIAHRMPELFATPIDDFLESWISWREACEDVRFAYQRWRDAPGPHQALAFAGYRAALDREEQAASAHAVCVERVRIDL